MNSNRFLPPDNYRDKACITSFGFVPVKMTLFIKRLRQTKLLAWFGSAYFDELSTAQHGTLEDLKRHFIRGNETGHEEFRYYRKEESV